MAWNVIAWKLKLFDNFLKPNEHLENVIVWKHLLRESLHGQQSISTRNRTVNGANKSLLSCGHLCHQNRNLLARNQSGFIWLQTTLSDIHLLIKVILNTKHHCTQAPWTPGSESPPQESPKIQGEKARCSWNMQPFWQLLAKAQGSFQSENTIFGNAWRNDQLEKHINKAHRKNTQWGPVPCNWYPMQTGSTHITIFMYVTVAQTSIGYNVV